MAMMCSRFRDVGLFMSASVILMADAMLLKQTIPQFVAEAPINTLLGSMKTSLVREMPVKKRIAVIFRGETFRHNYWDSAGIQHRAFCSKDSVELQLNCTRSVVEKVIEPLERNGSHVEVFFTSVSPLRTRLPLLIEHRNRLVPNLGEDMVGTGEGDCPLDALIIQALRATNRSVKWRRSVRTKGQAHTMIEVLGAFNEEHGGVAGVTKNFEHVYIVRNDLYWFQPIDQIHASFDKVNVLARCNHTGCVHDSFWMTPGAYYIVLSYCFGHESCFKIKEDPVGHGHGCQACISGQLAQFGFNESFGWLEPGIRRARVTAAVAEPDERSTHVADLTVNS